MGDFQAHTRFAQDQHGTGAVTVTGQIADLIGPPPRPGNVPLQVPTPSLIPAIASTPATPAATPGSSSRNGLNWPQAGGGDYGLPPQLPTPKAPPSAYPLWGQRTQKAGAAALTLMGTICQGMCAMPEVHFVNFAVQWFEDLGVLLGQVVCQNGSGSS